LTALFLGFKREEAAGSTRAIAFCPPSVGIQPPDEIDAKRYSNRKPEDETWDREFADSPLEEDGFELTVPPERKAFRER
jgi:hypothetical protein